MKNLCLNFRPVAYGIEFSVLGDDYLDQDDIYELPRDMMKDLLLDFRPVKEVTWDLLLMILV